MSVLNGTIGAQLPFWSADSRWVAFFAGGKLKKADLSGTPPLTIADAPAGRGGSWNSDGVIVFAPSTDGPLYRVSPSGRTGSGDRARSIARGDVACATVVPPGRQALYLRRQRHEVGGLRTVCGVDRFEGDQEADGCCPQGGVCAARFLLFMRGDTLVTQDLDIARLELSGEPTPVAAQVGTNATFLLSALAVSSNGVLAYRGAARDSALEWYDRPRCDRPSGARDAAKSPGRVPCLLDPRVVELSAWANSSKISACLSAGMPMPVSLT